MSRAAARLAGFSFLILFFELALIRYIPANVKIFSFYLNLVLIATFLGMGVGLLLVERAELLKWWGLVFTPLLFVAVKAFSNVLVRAPNDPDEVLWAIFFEVAPNVRKVGILPVASILFALCAAFFIPLGALMGREFRTFAPLKAYAIDIGGSLAGIAGFALLSQLRTSPSLWFGVGLFGYALLTWGRRRSSLMAGAVFATTLGVIVWTAESTQERWSPYYRINYFRAAPYAVAVNVNGSLHQYIIDVDTATARRNIFVQAIRGDYLQPFQFVPRVDTALVVGAGTGNDVALLLELGAHYIDAVEIDPEILKLGEREHVQRPYADPRVHLHVDDARAFLKKSTRTYDVLVFGTLDSQTLLSGMTSLRLDNYVYTVEAFKSARSHLKPDGRLITYHMSPQPYIASKIFGLVNEAFGEAPIVIFEPNHRLFNHTFIAGASPGSPLVARYPTPPHVLGNYPPPHDDWPYLYLARPTIPAHYLKMLGLLLLISLAMVGATTGRRLAGGLDGGMFFMGVGFLLVETKSVTEMSLLFGSTWEVNILVFFSILVMILAANLLVLRWKPLDLRMLFAALCGALLLAYLAPVQRLLGLGVFAQWVLGSLVVALPIFFAAIIFATLFKVRADSTRALAANLLGGILGAVIEYSSMAIGIKALYLLAIAAYAAAFLFVRKPGAALAATS